jgi:hypothetical membrane protein
MKAEESGRIFGLIGILIPIILIIFIFSAITMAPWFSWTDNAISDLGESGVPSATFFNYGIIITGFLLLIFTTVLSERIMGNGRLKKVNL